MEILEASTEKYKLHGPNDILIEFFFFPYALIIYFKSQFSFKTFFLNKKKKKHLAYNIRKKK